MVPPPDIILAEATDTPKNVEDPETITADAVTCPKVTLLVLLNATPPPLLNCALLDTSVPVGVVPLVPEVPFVPDVPDEPLAPVAPIEVQ